MTSVNMLEAKTNLSRLVDAVENGIEKEIIIARNGRPAARLVPVEAERKAVRIGIAKGKYRLPDDWDAHNSEIERLFYEGELFPAKT